MKRIRRTAHRHTSWLLVALAMTAGLAALPGASSAAPSLGRLNQELRATRSRQSSLQTSLAGLGRLVASLNGQVALVQSREAALRSDLERDQAALAAVAAALDRERRALAVLRSRLARARWVLARQLVSQYESGSPDLVDVVLESNGFSNLLERLTYLSDAERQQQALIAITRRAKARATRVARRLTALEATDRQLTRSTALRVRALAAMGTLLEAKQAALAHAQAIQRAALSATRERGSALRSQISQLEAQQAAAAASQSGFSSGPALGPSGGWAIPYPIVLCESGGQNLPPNGAGASGYYQILPSTWKLFGGTGPAAYLASKAEQDAVASRIWNGGSGASNWACAAIVGIH